MFTRASLVVGSLLLAGSGVCPAQDNGPSLSGPITAIHSLMDFDVAGIRVQAGPRTRFMVASDPKGLSLSSTNSPSPFLGEMLDVTGKVDHKSLSATATRIVFHPEFEHEVSGTAIIEKVGTDDSVQADGRKLTEVKNALRKPMALPSEAKPVDSPNDVRTNVWITYKGIQEPDGIVKLDRAALFANTVIRRS
jgi:hypothetical protein